MLTFLPFIISPTNIPGSTEKPQVLKSFSRLDSGIFAVCSFEGVLVF